ncbi:folate-binding protein YgfZ [Pseudactinotalea sp. HY158]|uniref:CAF17-like 4Fe-4S cluster assembly/insertion protein YgfZ n=1 Tax=Pseudactinotalea sp. HY158 TaxID=2654547 RepID=UPI00129C4C4D|nr:folate-binding protein YgfZ [Pseudactinotalea sp. HY158]QGH70540.1 folate-binding protein [Pseudactinotalea sp. HY158]
MSQPSPLTGRPGAVRALAPDEGVAAHYGEPVREQRALERGIAVVDLSHHGVVSVTGADRLSWLHTLSSQRLEGLAPGEATELMLLDVQGHIEHAAGVVDDGATTWLLVDSGRAEALAAYLEKMRFRYEVTVELPEVAVLGTSAAGPALAGARGEDLVVWRDPWPRTAEGSTRYGPADDVHPGSEWSAALWVVPSGDVTAVVDAALAVGGRLAGVWAWEAMRVATWRPRHNLDVDERALPHELDWLRTSVHLHKGCYRGQESIARVFNLGKPPRRLTFLHLDGSEHVIPDPGAEIIGPRDRVVGTLGSVVRHHELGPVGLALLKRNLDPEVDLVVSGIAAAQEVIVNTGGIGTDRPEQVDRSGLRRRDLGGAPHDLRGK